ncbi:MAG TPA: hypothetical protein VFD82_09155 [Planctomycetota bacterium]|nr:hypothetical protein [Planctomycetota bacterium]
MRLCCALVSLLGICGALPGQGRRQQVFDVGAALGALEDKVGAVPGDVQPVDRLERLLTDALQRDAMDAVEGVLQKAMIGPRRPVLLVHGDKKLLDLVQSVFDEMRREPLPLFHLTCTVLVMPAEIAASHGLSTIEVQEADMAAMTKLMRDVVKQRGTLLNLPEAIATPFVPFVAEQCVAAEGKRPPNDDENLRLRGEVLALSPEEVLCGVQLVRGSLPEDRTLLPEAAVSDRAFRLRVGTGVTITAKNDMTATVLWLRFTGTSTEAPKADKADKVGGR